MKSPAFQLYVNDFLGSAKVGMMSGQEIGIYMMLLFLDWQENGFVLEPTPLSRWCRVSLEEFEQGWKLVGLCFQKRRGRMYNSRLDLERTKQAEWRAKSSKGGLKSAQAKSKGGSKVVATKDQPKVNTPLPSPLPSPTPVTTTTLPKKRRTTWITPYADLWRQHYGGEMPIGKAVSVLAPLDKAHGSTETLRRWDIYLSETSGEYASASRFASTFNRWDSLAPPPTSHPPSDRATRSVEAIRQWMVGKENITDAEVITDGE